jgi:hypothetical protein
MAKITIDISCKKTTCHDCSLLNYSMMTGAYCCAFNNFVKAKGNGYLRLPECIKAEVKE